MDLTAVSAVLNGELSLSKKSKKSCKNDGKEDYEKTDDPDKLWSLFVTSGLTGVAFIAIALFLTLTNTYGGGVWGFWLLIPGAGSLGSGIASYLKAKRIERRREQQIAFAAANAANFPPQYNRSALPPQQTVDTDFYQSSARNTGELVESPASITEHTTRHLQQTSESETLNLPRK